MILGAKLAGIVAIVNQSHVVATLILDITKLSFTSCALAFKSDPVIVLPTPVTVNVSYAKSLFSKLNKTC